MNPRRLVDLVDRLCIFKHKQVDFAEICDAEIAGTCWSSLPDNTITHRSQRTSRLASLLTRLAATESRVSEVAL